MSLQSLVTTYGYPALLAGVALEGETIVIIAGFLAHQGYLRLPLVMLIAFIGAFGADQFFFQVGKRKGVSFISKRPKLDPRIDKVRRFLVGYQVIAILGYRFLYGMRTITPVIIGASGFETRRFVLLNLCSTLLWSAVVSSAGYFFGEMFDSVLKDIHRYELIAAVVMAVVAGAVWIYRYRYRPRKGAARTGRLS